MKLSQADQIRKLLHLSNTEIVRRTGFKYDHVSWTRQHTSPSGNPIQVPADYERDRKCKTERYRTDPKFRKRKLEIMAAYRARRRAGASG